MEVIVIKVTIFCRVHWCYRTRTLVYNVHVELDELHERWYFMKNLRSRISFVFILSMKLVCMFSSSVLAGGGAVEDSNVAAIKIQNTYRAYKRRAIERKFLNDIKGVLTNRNITAQNRLNQKVVMDRFQRNQNYSLITRLPDEIQIKILSNLNPADLKCAAESNVKFFQIARTKRVKQAAFVNGYKEQVKKIEELMNRFGSFIPLSGNNDWKNSNEAIAAAGVDQELFVTVMKHNPSKFKELKYCPNTHKVVFIDGAWVEMCPDFPVDSVSAQSRGVKDSDEELIERMNEIYHKAGLNIQFRRPTRAEYNWADTVGGVHPKVANNADDLVELGAAMPHMKISDRDPRNPQDATRTSPSKERQPRSMFDNAPNLLGFRRSGVWEWVGKGSQPDASSGNSGESEYDPNFGIVGGSWGDDPGFAVSGFWPPDEPGPEYRWAGIGSARFVRTQGVP